MTSGLDSRQASSFVTDYGHGIYAIDTGLMRPRFDASYLVVHRGRAAFVDTGTSHGLPRLLGALTHAGLALDAVDWVIPTHVHLDHAGGAGVLMNLLPNARLVVHPRGARHMIDPTALVAGATQVYGEEQMRNTYGQLLPVPATRVIEAAEGHVVDLAGRPLLCLDTPGHARHHICIYDALSESFFTGDTFGISYRETDCPDGAFVIPTSSPVQFEPEALKDSIRRMLSYRPQAMFLTHFGRVDQPDLRAKELIEQIDAMAHMAQACGQGDGCHAKLVAQLGEYYAHYAQRRGCLLSAAQVLDFLALDIELNAQGLEVWLSRQ